MERRLSQERISPEIAGELGFVVRKSPECNAFYVESWSDGSTRLRNIYMDPDCIQVTDEGLHVLEPEAVELIRTEREKKRTEAGPSRL